MSTDTKRVQIEFAEPQPEPQPEYKQITLTSRIAGRMPLDLTLESLPLGTSAEITTVTRRPQQARTVILRGAARTRERKTDGVPPRRLRIAAAARYVGTSEKALRKLVQNGTLPVSRKERDPETPGGRWSTSPWLFAREDLDALIEREKVG